MPSSFHKCVVCVTIHGLLNYFCSVSQLCSTHCDSFWVASNFLFLQTLLAGTFLTTDVCLWVFSYVQLFVALWTVAHRDPLFMDFSRQEYWSGLSFPSPGDLPDPEIKPMSPVQEASLALQADSLPLSHQDKIFKNFNKVIIIITTTLGSITMNKARGGDRIPAELFHIILKDDAVKVLHSICQQI